MRAKELTEEDLQLLDQLAKKIIKWRLGLPAILFLEMYKPLSFLGSQFMIVMGPVMHLFFSKVQYDRLAQILDHRDNVEHLLCLVESMERERG